MSISLDAGLLLVNATEEADVILIQPAGDMIAVSLNSSAFSAPLADVKRIKVLAGGGDDRVIIAAELRIRAQIFGGDGNDYLQAGAIATTLSGDAGHDTLVGGPGRDTFAGGRGIDTIDYSSRSENLSVSLDGIANDGLPPAGGSKGERDNLGADIENIIGGSGDDLLVGNKRRNMLVGGPGNDTLRGGAGADVLVGGTGADKLFGEAGDDILLLLDNDVSDTADGGAGFDTAAFDLFGENGDVLTGIETKLPLLA